MFEKWARSPVLRRGEITLRVAWNKLIERIRLILICGRSTRVARTLSFTKKWVWIAVWNANIHLIAP